MSNISSIIRNKAINTSHLSLSLNINNPYRSFYNLPIVSTFAKRDFPISILIPSFDNEEVNYLNSISFLAYINLTSSKIVLSRSGMVDCTFTKVSGNNSLYSCKTTGETLVVEGSNIKYIDDNKVSYYFSNNTGVSFINKVEFKDGYKLFVDIDKGVVTLSSAKLSDNNDLIYKAVLDCSKKEELKGSVYKELKGVRTLLSNIEISNRNIKIDCLISGDTLTTYVYKLGSKNIEYYKENKLKEEITVEEVANTNNIKIETYEENIGRQKYLVEIDAFKVVLKDESYKGYEKSETYVVSPVSTSVEDVQVRSIYDSYGKGTAIVYNESGQIVEIAENIPYVITSKALYSYDFKDITSVNHTDGVVSVVDNLFKYNNLVCDSTCKIPAKGYIKRTTNYKVYSRQDVLMCLLVKGESKVKISLSLNEVKVERVVESINEYSLISIGINSKKETGTISIEVENVGTNNIFVKNVQVLLNYKTTKIEYSEKTGLIVGMSQKGESVHQEVDIYGRTLYSYGSSESGINEYKVNNKYELLERSKDNLDREIKNTYQHLPQEHNLDNEGNYRVVKQEYKVENFYKESKASYIDETWLKESEEDSEGNKINYSYDKAEQVVEVEGQGEKIGYKYGREGEIEEYQFKDYSNSLSYDESILKEISTKYKETKKDSVKYEYDSKGRLTKVIGENNIEYLNIEYSTEKNIVTSSKVGENITLFSYDNYERLSGINQKEGKYSYQYNYKDIYDLESIEDKVNEITYEYIKNYRDLKSREVVKDKNGKELSSILISKDYLSEQGNEKIVDRDLNSQTSLVRGNIYYKGGEKTLYKEMIEQGYSVLSIIENNHALIGKEKALSPRSNICKNDSKIDYIKFIEPTKVSYTLNYKKGITLVFLLKGNKINVKVGTQISLNTNSESKLEVIKGTTIVEKSENSLSSGINVIGLTLSKEGEGYISVNEEVISLSGLSYSSIGVVEFNSEGKYGSIAIKEENINRAYLEEILRHYKELSKEKIQNELGNKSPSEEHSLVYLTNRDKEKETIIIALDNSFETNNMRSPYHLNIDDSNFKMSKRELFRYEKELRRSMYIAEGNNLSYELNSVNIETITLKIKPYLVRSNIERTIFAIGNDREEEIVVKQIGNKIRIDQNNRSYIVGKSNIETNKVNVISLSYALSIVSSGSSYGKNPDMKIRVRVNDIEDEVVFYDVEEFPTKLYMYVGIRGAGLKEPYYGQISDIRIRSKESSFNELKEYNQYSSPYEKQIVKDMIERPVIEYVVNRESKEIVRKKYSYQKEGIKDTNKIGREEIYVNNKSYINNEISYDEKQRVIKEGTREFTYTQEGYIKTDSKNSVSYEYDNLGNIVKKNEGGIEYTYKYLNNNRLKSVESNNKKINISYDESNPLYPSLIERSEGEKREEIKLSYEGRRLSIVEIGTKKYLYKYDSLGQRVIKEEGNNKERYQYQDGRIKQVEKEGEYSLIYSYSSNGIIQSVSEISNKDIKTYFYLIDIIGNIVGLVDENGNIVVEYDYSSYGKVEVKKDTVGISKKDHIRYKGYIYDEETKLYYLISRYYDPEIGRFISQDSVEYIEPSSISGLNLYVYCGNDPINMYDPSGNFAISIGLLLAIGGIVGAAIGAGASVAGQYLANGCSWENFSWGQLALDTVLGGVSGMLSMSPLGLGAMVAANAGLGFVGAVGGHLINGSDFSKGSTWLDIGLSTGLGALVGLIGGAGALNAGYLNGAKQTAGFIRAAGLYDDVLTKAVTGYYRTPGIASNALRLSGQNLVKQWNKMVVGQAGKALTKALAFGGTALLFGTAGKGLLYDWYNNYF